MAIRPTTPQSSADWDRMRDPENPQPPPAEAPLAERLRAWAREVDTDIDNLAPGWWQTEKGVPVTEKVQAVVTKVGSVWDKEVQPELDEHLPSVAKFTAQPPNLQVMQGGAAIGAVGAGIAVITGASIAALAFGALGIVCVFGAGEVVDLNNAVKMQEQLEELKQQLAESKLQLTQSAATLEEYKGIVEKLEVHLSESKESHQHQLEEQHAAHLSQIGQLTEENAQLVQSLNSLGTLLEQFGESTGAAQTLFQQTGTEHASLNDRFAALLESQKTQMQALKDYMDLSKGDTMKYQMLTNLIADARASKEQAAALAATLTNLQDAIVSASNELAAVKQELVMETREAKKANSEFRRSASANQEQFARMLASSSPQRPPSGL